jgi:translation initiation factor 2-alpha kinase 4
MDQSELNELHEIQSNEIEALKAIFMDDFQDVEEKKTAWNVRYFCIIYLHLLCSFIRSDHIMWITAGNTEFIIHLTPSEEEHEAAHTSVDLNVR